MDDFDKFLKNAREKEPSEFQMKKWKKAALMQSQQERVKTKRRSSLQYWGQMAAAVLVGIVVGGLLFGNLGEGNNKRDQEIAYENATIEVVYTKL